MLSLMYAYNKVPGVTDYVNYSEPRSSSREKGPSSSSKVKVSNLHVFDYNKARKVTIKIGGASLKLSLLSRLCFTASNIL